MKKPGTRCFPTVFFLFALLALASMSSAFSYLQAHNKTLSVGGSYSDTNIGVEITMKYTYNLTIINKSNQSGASTCYVKSYDGGITYFTGSFTDSRCVLNMQLNASQRYWIIADSGGGSHAVTQTIGCGAACTNISDSIINWTAGIYSGARAPTAIYAIQNLTFNDSIPTESPFITVNAILESANETEARPFTINVSGFNGNLTEFNITAIYNNTVLINESITGIFLPSYVYNYTVTSPLVTGNSSINYTVNVNAIQNYTTFNSGSDSDFQVVSTWYTIDHYISTPTTAYAVEEGNIIAITNRTAPPNATANVTFGGYVFTFNHCELWQANGTNVNMSCPNTISYSSPAAYTLGALHLQNTYVFTDQFINRSHNISFNATPESVSWKNLQEVYNATREYSVWLINSTNYTANATLINGTLTGLNASRMTNVSFYDEITQASISIDSAAMSYVLLFPDGTVKNFSVGYSGTAAIPGAIVNAYPNFYTANLSSIESYAKSAYATRNRFLLQSQNGLSAQANVSVYLIPLASATYGVINVVNNGLAVEGAYVQILKYYVTNGLYTNIDQEITDANGRAAGYYDVGAYYKFAVYDSSGNQLYFSTTPQKFVVSNSIYQVTIDISTTQELNFITPYVRANCEANNATNVIVCNYVDYAGKTNMIDFLVWRSSNVTGVSWAPVCNYTVSASSASYVCNLTAIGENMSLYQYTAVVRRSAPPRADIGWWLFDFRRATGFTDWGILALMVVLDAGVVGAIVHPVAGIATATITLFALSTLGYISIVPGTMVYLVTVAAIISYMLLRGN